ncbi:Beta-lactamase [Arthrobotrys entomopaga]|nr:Beta-lactamase [Arthrobotrys entomopaga]
MRQKIQTPYKEDLDSRINLIDAICRISGAAGLSCGVNLDGKTIFTHHYGYSDLKEKTSCDDDTIYPIGSLTKAFTACACAIAVEEGKLDWDVKIKDKVESFKFSDDYISEHLTLVDILCQRSGLANPAPLWLGKNNKILLDPRKFTQTCNNLPIMEGFRTAFRYNNLLYSLAGQILGDAYDCNTPEGYMLFLQQRIFVPLGLSRTGFDIDPSQKNVAKGYATLDDGRLRELPYPGLNTISGGAILAPCGGIRSSLKDMLVWTNALMNSANDDRPLGSNSNLARNISAPAKRGKLSSVLGKIRHVINPCNCLGGKPSDEDLLIPTGTNEKDTGLYQDNVVLKKSSVLLSPHNAGLASLALDPLPLLETSYALGWCRQSTPAKLGLFSKNRDLISDEIPLIGAKKPSTLIISHIGLLPGFASIAIMIPHLRCSLVVLANADTLGDVTDLVSQVLLEAILSPESRNDFESLARNAAAKDREYYKTQIEAPYNDGKSVFDIFRFNRFAEDFVGTYEGLGGNFSLVVKLARGKRESSEPFEASKGPQLILQIAGQESQSYDLTYYDQDTWGFLPNSDDLKGQAIPYRYWESFILRFHRKNPNDKVDGVYWKMEEGMQSIFFGLRGPHIN